MDYERIHNTTPQGGTISPRKLRLMLLGVDKKRVAAGGEEGRKELSCSLRSTDAGDVHEGGGSSPDFAARPDSCCRDVDVVSSPAECSTSTGTVPRAKNQTPSANTRGFRSQEEECVDVGSLMPSSSAFEFQKADRASQRASMVPPFAKTAPSKWDDAQKWIASPTFNRSGKGGGAQVKRGGNLSHGSRMAATTKVIAEVSVEPDTKRIDHSQMKSVNWVYDDAPPVAEAYTKTAVFEESPIAVDAASSAINLSHHESSMSNQSATSFIQPPSTVRSISMRDMGTEMTPIPSQEPSRSGTPVRASTPIRSPSLSQPSSPGRVAPNSTPAEYVGSCGDPNKRVLSDKELQMKTRREIMILGTKLGKTNIAAWASREEEEQDASRSLKTVPLERPEKQAIEIRASAWEEAEKAKYLARFKREEMKIQAWENHQKAKAEAEMRKVEVEVERLRVRAHEKLKDRLDAIRQKAEGRRVAAEAKRNRQAAQTAAQVDYIRRTGKMPSSCWGCCS